MQSPEGSTRRSRRHARRHPHPAGERPQGRITIGAGAIIGGNVWLTRSVPPGSVVTQVDHAIGAIQRLD